MSLVAEMREKNPEGGEMQKRLGKILLLSGGLQIFCGVYSPAWMVYSPVWLNSFWRVYARNCWLLAVLLVNGFCEYAIRGFFYNSVEKISRLVFLKLVEFLIVSNEQYSGEIWMLL